MNRFIESKAGSNWSHASRRAAERFGVSLEVIENAVQAIKTHGNSHSNGVVMLRPDHRGSSRTLWAVRESLEDRPGICWLPVVYDNATSSPISVLPDYALDHYCQLLAEIERANGWHREKDRRELPQLTFSRRVKTEPRPQTGTVTIQDLMRKRLDGVPEHNEAMLMELIGFAGESVESLGLEDVDAALLAIRDLHAKLNNGPVKNVPLSTALSDLKYRMKRQKFEVNESQRVLLIANGLDDTESLLFALLNAGREMSGLLKRNSLSDSVSRATWDAMAAAKSYFNLKGIETD